jgi:WD40 repeat protein/serine/threonine protein kinase
MPIDSTECFIEALHRLRLLAPAQVEELGRMRPPFTEPRALARELIRRDWLTAYQINRLFTGHGEQLILGQYVLLERLGEGGMGQVLKARHQRLERTVALKQIRKERLDSPAAVQRFQREARAAARLSHPNIVTVYDADEVAGTHFFVMEYVEGTDLAKLVQGQGPLTVQQACDCVRQAALGLQHAHEQGLVHRDIKPANLFLTNKGVVKVLDMGLARLEGPAGHDGGATDPTTCEGAVMGTPDFMAPEQAADSHAADVRADLYSLGCTLYFLLTGRVPFPGGSLTEKLLKHQTGPVPRVEAVRPDVPPGVAAVARKLMAKRPADRYQTPAELAEALGPFCGTRPPLAIPAGPTVAYVPPSPGEQTTPAGGATQSRPPPLPLAATVALSARAAGPRKEGAKGWRYLALAGGGLLLLLVLFLILRSGKPTTRGEDDPQTRSWPLDNLEPSAFRPVKEFDDWPPKGLVLVLGSHRGRHWGRVWGVAYSPDGKFVASAGADARICVWKAADLAEYRVLRGHEGTVYCLAFGPDSKTLISGGADKTVRVWDVEKGMERLSLTEHKDPISCVAFCAKGSQAMSAANGLDSSIRFWDLAGKGKELESRRLAGHQGGTYGFAVPSNEQYVASVGADKRVRLWEFGTGNQLKEFDATQNGNRPFSVAVSSDAQRILCGVWDSVLQWNVGTEVRLMPGPAAKGQVWTVRFSPDGKRAVSVGGKSEITLWDTVTDTDTGTGRVLRTFAGHVGTITGCAFSPDGKFLVSGGDDGTVRLWDIEGEKEIVPRPGHTHAVSCVAFSKDGRYALTGGADGTVRLWDLASDPPGREAKSFTGHAGTVTGVAFAPDGQRLFSCGLDGTARTWITSDGKETGRLESRIGDPLGAGFSPNSQYVSFWGRHARALELESGRELKFFPVEGAMMTSAAVSSDGRRAAIAWETRKVFMWDGRRSADLEILPLEPPTAVSASIFIRDTHRLLTGHEDGTVRLWDLDKGAAHKPTLFLGHQKPVTSISSSADDTMVAASFLDGKVIVWDATTQKPRHKWKLPGAVHGVIFDEKGRHLATANGNGTVFVLRLREP